MSSNMVTLRCPACNAPFPPGSSNKMEIKCPYCGQVTYNNFAVSNRSDAINSISVVVPGCTDDDAKRFFIEALVRKDYVPVDIFDSFNINDIRHNLFPVYLFNVNWSANWSAVFSHQVSHEEPTYDYNGKRTGTKTVYETEYRDANGTSAGDSRIVLSGLREGFHNQSEICDSYSWSTVIDPEFPEIETRGISDVESEELNGWKLIEPNMSSDEAWKNGGKEVVEDDVDGQVSRDSWSMSAGWIVESRHYTYRYTEGKGQCVLLPIWEADYQYANGNIFKKNFESSWLCLFWNFFCSNHPFFGIAKFFRKPNSVLRNDCFGHCFMGAYPSCPTQETEFGKRFQQ